MARTWERLLIRYASAPVLRIFQVRRSCLLLYSSLFIGWKSGRFVRVFAVIVIIPVLSSTRVPPPSLESFVQRERSREFRRYSASLSSARLLASAAPTGAGSPQSSPADDLRGKPRRRLLQSPRRRAGRSLEAEESGWRENGHSQRGHRGKSHRVKSELTLCGKIVWNLFRLIIRSPVCTRLTSCLYTFLR